LWKKAVGHQALKLKDQQHSRLENLHPSKYFYVQKKILTKLYKDIIGRVEGNLFKVFANQDLDRVLIPVFRNVLTHQMRLQKKNKNNIKIIPEGQNTFSY